MALNENEKRILAEAKEIEVREQKQAKAKRTRKRKGTFSNIVLILVAVYVVYFNERVFSLTEKGFTVSDMQIDKTLTCLLGEVLVLALIKIIKIKKGD